MVPRYALRKMPRLAFSTRRVPRAQARRLYDRITPESGRAAVVNLIGDDTTLYRAISVDLLLCRLLRVLYAW